MLYVTYSVQKVNIKIIFTFTFVRLGLLVCDQRYTENQSLRGEISYWTRVINNVLLNVWLSVTTQFPTGSVAVYREADSIQFEEGHSVKGKLKPNSIEQNMLKVTVAYYGRQ